MIYVSVKGTERPAFAVDACHVYWYRHQTKTHHPVHLREILQPGEWELLLLVREMQRRMAMATIIAQIKQLERSAVVAA